MPKTARSGNTELIKIYRILLNYFGPQGWWPVNGVYNPRKDFFSPLEKFEIMAGAILTQNSAWTNAEKALGNLRMKGCLSPAKISGMELNLLEKLVHPSGFYRQKAHRLKNFSKYAVSSGRKIGAASRKELLALDGIGPETADSIMLYAFNKPYFVADAYTRRLAERLGILRNGNYEETRAYFEARLPGDENIYKEFHALIVALSKRFCKNTPACAGCPLVKLCRYGNSIKKRSTAASIRRAARGSTP